MQQGPQFGGHDFGEPVAAGAAIQAVARGHKAVADPDSFASISVLRRLTGWKVMTSDRASQAVETQSTHRSDGIEVGVKAHQFGVVVQSQGGHQQMEAEHGAANPAAGLPQFDRLLLQIRWCGW